MNNNNTDNSNNKIINNNTNIIKIISIECNKNIYKKINIQIILINSKKEILNLIIKTQINSVRNT
jgi:hypothetical protein